MARQDKTQFANSSANAKTPVKELVVKFHHPEMGEMGLGRIGLFEGNDLHELLMNASQDDIDQFMTMLSATVVEYGEAKKPKLNSLFGK